MKKIIFRGIAIVMAIGFCVYDTEAISKPCLQRTFLDVSYDQIFAFNEFIYESKKSILADISIDRQCANTSDNTQVCSYARQMQQEAQIKEQAADARLKTAQAAALEKQKCGPESVSCFDEQAAARNLSSRLEPLLAHIAESNKLFDGIRAMDCSVEQNPEQCKELKKLANQNGLLLSMAQSMNRSAEKVLQSTRNGPAEDVTQGTAFSAQGNYAEAMKLYAKAADAGDADGLFFLGRMYEKGQGVAQDIPRGMGLYIKAAEAGQPFAMTLAGVAYLKGDAGLEKNVREAVRLFTKAADAGNVSAMSILGVMYMNGDSDSGLVQNYPEALKLLTRASQMVDNSAPNINLGSVQAMSALGIMYQNGLGVPQDLPRAADLYQRVIAAGAGDAFPQTRANLAIILKIRPDLKK